MSIKSLLPLANACDRPGFSAAVDNLYQLLGVQTTKSNVVQTVANMIIGCYSGSDTDLCTVMDAWFCHHIEQLTRLNEDHFNDRVVVLNNVLSMCETFPARFVCVDNFAKRCSNSPALSSQKKLIEDGIRGCLSTFMGKNTHIDWPQHTAEIHKFMEKGGVTQRMLVGQALKCGNKKLLQAVIEDRGLEDVEGLWVVYSTATARVELALYQSKDEIAKHGKIDVSKGTQMMHMAAPFTSFDHFLRCAQSPMDKYSNPVSQVMSDIIALVERTPLEVLPSVAKQLDKRTLMELNMIIDVLPPATQHNALMEKLSAVDGINGCLPNTAAWKAQQQRQRILQDVEVDGSGVSSAPKRMI